MKLFNKLPLVLVFFALLFMLSFFGSCKKQNPPAVVLYKQEVNMPEDSSGVDFTKEYDPVYNDSLTTDLSILLNTQLYYTDMVKQKTKNQDIVDFAENMLTEFKGLQDEMASIISQTKQERIFHRSTKHLTIDKLEQNYFDAYDREFLKEIIKIQLSIKQLLIQIKDNLKNADLNIFYDKIIQETDLRVDQATNLIENV
ncbi:DUF4142 domain-containing protein [Myroides sp. LJL119]